MFVFELIKSVISLISLCFMLFPGDDSEPSIAIGQSNGDHDLARTVLEVSNEYSFSKSLCVNIFKALS